MIFLLKRSAVKIVAWNNIIVHRSDELKPVSGVLFSHPKPACHSCASGRMNDVELFSK
jgi:hypothetical protein